jgi:hypothetical protein
MQPFPLGLRCAGCDAGLAPADIDLLRAVASCPRCGAEHDLQLQLRQREVPDRGRADPELPSSALDPAPPAAVARTAEVQVDAEALPAPRRPGGWFDQLQDAFDDALERVEAVGVGRWLHQRIGRGFTLGWPAFPPGLPTPATALRASEDEHGLRIEWGWFGLPAVGLMMGTAVWSTWIAGWAAAAVLLAGTALGVVMVLAALVHLLTTIALTWVAAAGLVDRTRVRVTEGALHVWHGPVPWPGPRRIPAARVQQVQVVPRTVRGRDGHRVELFDVVAGLGDGRLPIARGSWSREAAEALAASVERWLGVRSEAVRLSRHAAEPSRR